MQQQIDDARKHGIDLLKYIDHKWAAFMGRKVCDECKKSLKRSMCLLEIFERAGKKAEEDKRFLKWHTPLLPVVQNYTEGIVKKVWVQFGPPNIRNPSTGHFINTLQLNVCFIEKQIPSKRKQSQGAAPNAIHSLDAVHLAMVVDVCDFPTATIHDSYGAHLCNMDVLFYISRRTFVDMYKENPLEGILNEIQADISEVDIGNLNIESVMESDYCFL